MSGETDNIDAGLIGDLNVADQFLEQVEGTSYNMHTDSNVALGLNAALSAAIELGKETIIKADNFKPLSPAQAKAVDLYHAPGAGASTGAMHSEDRVVAVESEAEKTVFDKARQATIKGVLSTTEHMVEDLLDQSVGGFRHYAKLAKDLKAYLSQHRKTIKDNPDYYTVEESMSMGAYTRFFQAAGKKLTSFEDFAMVFRTLSGCVDFSLKSGAPLADTNARTMITALASIQTNKTSLDADDLELILDRMRDDHLDVWRNAQADMPQLLEANKAYKPWVPASLGFTGKTRGGVAALFDNHALVWTAPVDFDAVTTSAKNLRADFFGAVLERDKSLDQKFEKDESYIPMPDNRQLADLLDEAISMLSTAERYVEFGDRIKKHGSGIKSQLKALNAIVASDTNDSKITVADYMPFVLSVMRSFTSPHIKLLWQAVRAAIMLAAIADTRLVIDPNARKYASVAKATSDKISLKLDVSMEPDEAAAKEVGYFNSLLVKLKVK